MGVFVKGVSEKLSSKLWYMVVVVAVLRCAVVVKEDTLKNPRVHVTKKSSPCVPATRPHV